MARLQVYVVTPKRQALLLHSLEVRKKIGEPTSNCGRHYTEGPDGRKVLMGAGTSTSYQYPYVAPSFGFKSDIFGM